jgi:hypothetical protein
MQSRFGLWTVGCGHPKRRISAEARDEIDLVRHRVEDVLGEEIAPPRRVVAVAADQQPSRRDRSGGGDRERARGADQRPVREQLDAVAHQEVMSPRSGAVDAPDPGARSARVAGVRW